MSNIADIRKDYQKESLSESDVKIDPFLQFDVWWADALASASAYTGMWLMAKKKVESWIWWIITNIASIPLYFIKGYAFTSFQFLVLLVLAFAGWKSWYEKQAEQKRTEGKLFIEETI